MKTNISIKIKVTRDLDKPTPKLQHPWIRSKYGYDVQVRITPELAVFLLNHYNLLNKGVRDMNAKHTGKIVSALRNGTFQSETGLNIAFRKDGMIIDGQGRLMACAMTGIDLVVDVCFGMEKDVIKYRDGNRARNDAVRSVIADMDETLSEEEKRVLKSTRSSCFAISRVWIWQESNWAKAFTGDLDSLEKFTIDKFEHMEKVLDPIDFKVKNAGFRAACAQYIEKFPKKGIEFFNQVTGDGSNLPSGSPILALRNHYVVRPNQGNQKQQREDFCATLSAIHAFHKNITLKQVKCQELWEI